MGVVSIFCVPTLSASVIMVKIIALLATVGNALSIDCSTSACPDSCACSLDQCATEINACLADDTCAAAQSCALACPCNDDACVLKCAASSPSIKALPAANCINSKCSSASLK